MTDPIELFKKLLDEMSYYNAAEGPDWYDEIGRRNSAYNKLQASTQGLLDSGVELDDLLEIVRTGTYLVHDSDWMPHDVWKAWQKKKYGG